MRYIKKDSPGKLILHWGLINIVCQSKWRVKKKGNLYKVSIPLQGPSIFWKFFQSVELEVKVKKGEVSFKMFHLGAMRVFFESVEEFEEKIRTCVGEEEAGQCAKFASISLESVRGNINDKELLQFLLEDGFFTELDEVQKSVSTDTIVYKSKFSIRQESLLYGLCTTVHFQDLPILTAPNKNFVVKFDRFGWTILCSTQKTLNQLQGLPEDLKNVG